MGYTSALQRRLTEGRALLEEAISEDVRAGTLELHTRRVALLSEICRLAGHGEEAWQYARQALAVARQQKERGNEALALYQLGVVQSHATPLLSRRPKPTTSRLWPWLKNWACARSRPTATTG